MPETVTEPQTAPEIGRSFAPPAVRQGGAVAATDQPGPLLAAIVDMAKDPSVDVAKLQALLTMQERLEERQAEREFDRAFIEMKPHLPIVEKDGRITYEAKQGRAGAAIPYATLEGIDELVTPVLQRFGFAASYRMKREPEGQVAVCILRHIGGHKTETDGPTLPCDSSGGKNNIQGWGSAMKYGCRYALVAALNIRVKGKDDDGKLGGMRFITGQQVAELEKLIERTNSDRGKYLQILGVADVSNIEAGAWAAARNLLLSKVKG